MTKQLSYWIKERHNPQIGVYYTALGQISKAEARRHTKPLYGANIRLEFQDKESYEKKIKELKRAGCRIS